MCFIGGPWGKVGAGYQERWPDTWEEELYNKLTGPLYLGVDR